MRAFKFHIYFSSHTRTVPVRGLQRPVRELVPVHEWERLRELCPFAAFSGRFASWFQFTNGKDFCEHAKCLAWLWIKGEGEGENASVYADNGRSGKSYKRL